MSSTKVVSMSAFKRSTAAQPAVSVEEVPDELSDATITKFFRVVDYIRSISSDSAATIEVTPDELKIQTRHCGEVQECDGTVQGASVLCLTSSMSFDDKKDVEDFRDVIDYLHLE